MHTHEELGSNILLNVLTACRIFKIDATTLKGNNRRSHANTIANIYMYRVIRNLVIHRHYRVMYYTVLYNLLHSITVSCSVLLRTAPYCSALLCTAQKCHCSPLLRAALHSTMVSSADCGAPAQPHLTVVRYWQVDLDRLLQHSQPLRAEGRQVRPRAVVRLRAGLGQVFRLRERERERGFIDNQEVTEGW
jgi:hypothetical protein